MPLNRPQTRPNALRRGTLAVAVAIFLSVQPCFAGATPVSLDISLDGSWTAGPTVAGDQAVLRFEAPQIVAQLDLGALPANTDVSAFDLDDDRLYFTLDRFANFAGGLQVGPRDVVSWNGSTHGLRLSGAAAGIPSGAKIDALADTSENGAQEILLSFDVSVALPGGVHANDEDLLSWDGRQWAIFLDGSKLGLPEALDIDALDIDPITGELFLSFDTSGTLGALVFGDEDVVSFDGEVWAVVLDASIQLGSSFAAGNLDALAVRTSNLFKDGFESGSFQAWSAHHP